MRYPLFFMDVQQLHHVPTNTCIGSSIELTARVGRHLQTTGFFFPSVVLCLKRLPSKGDWVVGKLGDGRRSLLST